VSEIILCSFLILKRRDVMSEIIVSSIKEFRSEIKKGTKEIIYHYENKHLNINDLPPMGVVSINRLPIEDLVAIILSKALLAAFIYAISKGYGVDIEIEDKKIRFTKQSK
jgi:hypothetical protein